MFKKLQLALVATIALGSIAHAQVGRTAATAAFMAGYLGYKYQNKIINLFSSKNAAALVAEQAPKNVVALQPALSFEYSMSLIDKVPWAPILLIYGLYSTYNTAGKPRTCVWDYVKPHLSSLCASLTGAAVLYAADCIAGGNAAVSTAPAVVTPVAAAQ